MITGDLKSKIDRTWDAFRSGGISNPLEVIEQITILLFLRYLDDMQIQEHKACRLTEPVTDPTFLPGQQHLSWSSSRTRIQPSPAGGTLTYDGYNVKTIQSANGAESVFDYADGGAGGENENRPSAYTNAQGSVLNYQWGNDQQLTTVKNGANPNKAQMTYRGANQSCSGQLATAKDGNANTSSYTYNARCNLTKIDRPAPAGDTTMTYDTTDRVATITDGKGNRQAVTYDGLDRVTRIRYYTPGA